MKMKDGPSTSLTTALPFGLQKKSLLPHVLLTPKTEPTSDGGQEGPIQIGIAEKQLGNGCFNVG